MNGGTWWDSNGFGAKWTGPVNLASDSFFGLAGSGFSLTIDGAISGPGGFTCNGDNWFVGLFAANSYQGPTIVSTGLTDPWSSNVAAVPASSSVVNGVDFQINSSGALDVIEATIPSTEAAAGKLFGRLSGVAN